MPNLQHMPFVLLLIGVVVLGLFVVTAGRWSARSRQPYRRKPLLTPWERQALRDIRAQLPPGMHLCAQVRLGDMLSVAEKDPRRRTQAFNRVACKSIDFVIVDVASGETVLAIELDDKSHNREDRRQRDAFVNAVLDDAGIPLARFKPSQRIDVGKHLGAIAAAGVRRPGAATAGRGAYA